MQLALHSESGSGFGSFVYLFQAAGSHQQAATVEPCIKGCSAVCNTLLLLVYHCPTTAPKWGRPSLTLPPAGGRAEAARCHADSVAGEAAGAHS